MTDLEKMIEVANDSCCLWEYSKATRCLTIYHRNDNSKMIFYFNESGTLYQII